MKNRDIKKSIGNRIKYYRKLNNYSMQEFASLINKSKSSLSKYESGQISVDIELLFLIAQVLNISVYQLIDSELKDVNIINNVKIDQINNSKLLYIYRWDGRTKSHLRRGVIKLDINSNSVLYYSTVSDINDYHCCQYIYYGNYLITTSQTRLQLKNYTNELDILLISYPHILTFDKSCTGFLTSFSIGQFIPYSAKCIISNIPMKEDQALVDSLMLSKDNINNMKKQNMFMLQYYQDFNINFK